LHYARIFVGHGNINLLKYPVKCTVNVRFPAY
jgi:hypothetical protein